MALSVYFFLNSIFAYKNSIEPDHLVSDKAN